MSYRGRNYAADGPQYRGYVHEVGERMTSETVYDETKEEHADRVATWVTLHGNTWRMADRYRKSHSEDRDLQPYEKTRTFGPYSTIGPAKSAAGTGRDVRKVTTGTHRNGGTFTRTAEVHVGTVAWALPE